MTKQLSLLLVVAAVGCSSQTPPAAAPKAATSSSETSSDVTVSGTVEGKPNSPDAVEAEGKPQDAAAVTTAEPPFQLEEGFTQLGFADFEAFGAEAATWEGTADGIKSSGKPKGYLYSKQPYQNFTMRLDYRFPRPANLKDEAKFKGNTGFLVYITGEHKLWPVCLEVQGKHIQMAAIKENGGAQPVTATDDEAARLKARHAVGEWNAIEIVSTNGALSVSLNGTPISKCEPDFLSEGSIGIQAEDHPFEVRRIRIRRD
jgi:hypothetical protein